MMILPFRVTAAAAAAAGGERRSMTTTPLLWWWGCRRCFFSRGCGGGVVSSPIIFPLLFARSSCQRSSLRRRGIVWKFCTVVGDTITTCLSEYYPHRGVRPSIHRTHSRISKSVVSVHRAHSMEETTVLLLEWT
jgi:hypothetical protein